jgi:hypothetical protein
MPSVIAFHVYPNPPECKRVVVDVREGRRAAGQFKVTAAAGWRKLRERLTPPGIDGIRRDLEEDLHTTFTILTRSSLGMTKWLIAWHLIQGYDREREK